MNQAMLLAATQTTSPQLWSHVDSEPAALDSARPSEPHSVLREFVLRDPKTVRSIWMFGHNQVKGQRPPDLQVPSDGVHQSAMWKKVRAAVTIRTATTHTKTSVNGRAS